MKHTIICFAFQANFCLAQAYGRLFSKVNQSSQYQAALSWNDGIAGDLISQRDDLISTIEKKGRFLNENSNHQDQQ